LIEKVIEGVVVHEMLESSGSISTAKVHHEKFIGAVVGSKGSFPFIAFGNLDQVISRLQIDFREDFHLGKPIEKFVDPQKQVSILLCNFVNPLIVDASHLFSWRKQ
jgi:hypothetical protein